MLAGEDAEAAAWPSSGSSPGCPSRKRLRPCPFPGPARTGSGPMHGPGCMPGLRTNRGRLNPEPLRRSGAVLACIHGPGPWQARTMNVDPNQIKAIFLEAVEKHDPRAMAGLSRPGLRRPAELRRRVEVLLQAHREAGTALHDASAEGPVLATVDLVGSAAQPGSVIGPYKLLQQIGEGGMGTVCMAEQTAAGPAQGRPQDHQARHGQRPGARPLRGRAAGPGPDGPPQHRQGPRRRRHRRRAGPTSSWSWSRACRSPSTATSTA